MKKPQKNKKTRNRVPKGISKYKLKLPQGKINITQKLVHKSTTTHRIIG